MGQPECDGVGVSLISLTVPHNMTFFDFVGIFWSLIPYAMPAALVFAFFFTRRISPFIFFVFGMVAAAINEFVVKKIHEEDRPIKSCLDSGAFPSGHALISGLYFVWFILEIIVHPRWSLRKRILYILGTIVLLGPCGPARKVVDDHTWSQIYGGIIIGAIWGLLLFLISQFVIARYLEYIMNWRIVKKLGLRNDFRPNYEHSKNKGAKAPATPTSGERKKPSTALFLATHIIVIFLNIALGALGLALGFVKDERDSNCERSAPGVVISIGGITLALALVQIIITALIHRKTQEKSWWPEGVQILLFLAALLQFEGFFWSIAGISTSTDEDNCPNNGKPDVALIYSILWMAVTVAILVFASIMAKVLGLRRLYGFRKTLPGGAKSNTPNHDKIAEAEKPAQPVEKPAAQTNSIPPAMNAV